MRYKTKIFPAKHKFERGKVYLTTSQSLANDMIGRFIKDPTYYARAATDRGGTSYDFVTYAVYEVTEPEMNDLGEVHP